MKYCILMGSPHRNGNTASILLPFKEELEKSGGEVDCIWLYDKKIKPCIGCRICQDIFDAFGCQIMDDMQEIFKSVYNADCIVLATPIYGWFCTSPMKAALDRLVFGMNKYYGQEKGTSLWSGKKCLIITTCGYEPEKGADVFEEAIKRYCKHSKLDYLGMLAIRDLGSKHKCINEERIKESRNFAQQLILRLKDK